VEARKGMACEGMRSQGMEWKLKARKGKARQVEA